MTNNSSIHGLVRPVVRRCYAAGDAHGRPGWRVAVGYDADLVALFKTIPHEDREWHPDKSEWWFAKEHEAALRRFLPNLAVFLDQPRLL